MDYVTMTTTVSGNFIGNITSYKKSLTYDNILDMQPILQGDINNDINDNYHFYCVQLIRSYLAYYDVWFEKYSEWL